MGSTGVDVVPPSLHVAVSLFILGFEFRHNRRRFWICRYRAWARELQPCTCATTT
ncbi:MAG: hypothetical protein IPM27_11565 [Nitrosomonadales bacterium]|nr:hypothetical protein [Nitrosomonadales bacterium]